MHAVEQTGKSTAGAQAIVRAMQVLRVVAQLQRSGATAGKVALATGLTRPTVFRIMQALEDERMLEPRDEGKGYRLGPLAYELGLAAKMEETPQDRWQPAVAKVAARTRLTSYLIGRSGEEAVCLLCIQGLTPIRAMPVEVGQRVPLGLGAGSLAILASLPDEDIKRLYAGSFRSVHGMSEAQVWDRIARTRKAGFSVSHGTVAKGVSGVGVLIPKQPVEAGLAITVSAVANEMSPAEAMKIARDISRTIHEFV